MQDVLYLAIIAAFFVLAVGFVYACDRIIGPDEEALADSTDDLIEIKSKAA
jgi:hypothetical protein